MLLADEEMEPGTSRPGISLWMIIDINLENAVEMLHPDSPWNQWHEDDQEQELKDMYSYLGKQGHTVSAKLKMIKDDKEPTYDRARQIALRLAGYSPDGQYINPGYAKELAEVGRIEAQAEVVRRKKDVSEHPELKRRIYEKYEETKPTIARL